jgi:polyphenol oxidase
MFERRLLPGGVTALVSTMLESDGFLAAFTERTGGQSPSPYDSLNLGYSTLDDGANVAANRDRVRSALGAGRFTFGHQVHGARVSRVGEARAGAGYDDPAATLPRTDAMVTSRRGVPLAVLTADCVPIAMADPSVGRLVVIHAGWRGVAGGIVQRAVAAFPEPRRVRAAVGPAIAPDHYEVGPDVAAMVEAGAGGHAVVVRGEGQGRPRVDLPGTAGAVLRSLGVRDVEVAELCTACLVERFFSHRRDGPTGRQALVAVRLT